jgi:predicted dehydrogenase
LKILIIGLGSIGRKHVDGILNYLPDALIYAFRSDNGEDLYRTVKNIYDKSEIPLDINFVVISNITVAHADTILDMVQYKCPLFIEKPVLSNISKAEEISKQLKESGIDSYVACNMRFYPAIVFIENYLKSNNLRINEVNIYCGSYLPEWRPGKDFRAIYSANKLMGGGVHLDLIHELDYCCWLFGFPNSTKCLHMNKSSLNIDAIDSARYLFAYTEFNACISLNYYRRDAKRQIEIITADDTLIVDLLQNKVTSNVSGEILFQSDVGIIDTYTRQIEYFVNQIKAGGVLMNNFDYSISILKLAIHE